MGSLVPGWDSASPGLPPKDLQDHLDDEHEQKEGYFARYQRQKSLKRKDSLRSKDQQEGQESDTVDGLPNLATRSWSPHMPSGSPGSPSRSRTLQRSSLSIPAARAGSLETELDSVLQRTRTTPMQVPYTRRTQPQSVPHHGPASPDATWGSHSWGAGGKSAPEVDLSHYRDKEKKSEAWWRKFSSSHLNELTEEGDSVASKHSPYLPQHSVVGQTMQYRGVGDKGCGGLEQREKEEAGAPAGPHNMLPVH